MNKGDSNIAASADNKGTDGAEWLRFLQGAGEATRSAHDDADRVEPDRNPGVASISAVESAQPAKQQAATAGSGPRGRGAKTGKLFSAGRES